MQRPRGDTEAAEYSSVALRGAGGVTRGTFLGRVLANTVHGFTNAGTWAHGARPKRTRAPFERPAGDQVVLRCASVAMGPAFYARGP